MNMIEKLWECVRSNESDRNVMEVIVELWELCEKLRKADMKK